MSLVVSLYGGPGTGKSTTAALVFAQLKQEGFNAELVNEYAKDLTWEQRQWTLSNQPYVTAKQLWRLDRLGDQVDVAVTDTSSLLALIHGKNLLPEYVQYILADHRSRDTLDIFLERDPDRKYNPSGRRETQAQAEALDNDILDLLVFTGQKYSTVRVKSDGSHAREIVKLIRGSLS